MNYTELKDAVKAYVENDFPTTTAGSLTSTAQLDIFIRQAERRIYNSVQLLDLRKNGTDTLSASDAYLTLPTDWQAMHSLAVQNGSGVYFYLDNKDLNFLREAYPDPTATGLPKYYALYDKETLLLAPTPDDAYTVAWSYFYYPNSIVDDATSWLGDNFDMPLLYGTLLEAATFMQSEPDLVALYQQRYSEAMDQLRNLASGKQRQDNYRTAQLRVPVQ